MMRINYVERALRGLLRDFGYAVEGGVIIRKGIRGWCQDSVCGRARSLMDACEQLCPIIREDEFTARLNEICNPKEEPDDGAGPYSGW